jgi:hypothetical protein
MSSSAGPPHSRITPAISRERDAVRQQLSEAWQIQALRVQEALATGWREGLDRILNERFADLAARMEREFASAADERVAADLAIASRQRTEELNRTFRRLTVWEDWEQWAAALLDSVGALCFQAALLAVRPPSLRALRGLRLREGVAFEGLQVSLAEAPGIAAAIASKDTVIALATAAELSKGIARLFGGGRCAILPVVACERVAAVLVAVADPAEVGGLEAMTALAGVALDRRKRPEPLPEAAGSAGDEALFLRAQRFARVRVAEIRLSKSREVVEARAGSRIYEMLKEEMDSARVAYARQFLQASPFMPDYLHVEFLRTLANDDIAVLGEEYPGPMA